MVPSCHWQRVRYTGPVADRLPGSPSPLRTLVAASILVLFVGAFTLSSLVEWARQTVLDPAYVKPLLRDAGAYAFVREEALPAWLDRQLDAFGVEEAQHRAFAVQVLLDVVGEEELRERVEHVLDEALPFATGDRDELTIRPRLSEWVLEVPEALARLEFPAWLVDAVLAPRLRPALAALASEPLSVPVEPGEAREIARLIAPPEWTDGQVVGATYAVARWAVGAQRTFEIRIDYSERVGPATTVFKQLLRRSRVEDVLLDRVVVPMAAQALSELEPFSEEVPDGALRESIRRAAPRGWIARQVDGVIDAMGEWLAGRRTDLVYTVQTGSLAGAADRIVREMLRQTLGDDAGPLAGPLLARVRRYFPEQTVWSSENLRAGVGEETFEQLLTVRRMVTEGFAYDHEDLRRDLRSQLGLGDEQIDRVRHVLGASYAYTEADLFGAGLGTEAESVLLSARSAMRYELVPHVVSLVLLVGLFAAAGPGGFRRGLYALAAFAAGGLVVWVVAAPAVAATLEAHLVAALPGSEELAGHPFLDGLLERLRQTAGVLAAWGRAVFLLGAVAFVLLALAAMRARTMARS